MDDLLETNKSILDTINSLDSQVDKQNILKMYLEEIPMKQIVTKMLKRHLNGHQSLSDRKDLLNRVEEETSSANERFFGEPELDCMIQQAIECQTWSKINRLIPAFVSHFKHLKTLDVLTFQEQTEMM